MPKKKKLEVLSWPELSDIERFGLRTRGPRVRGGGSRKRLLWMNFGGGECERTNAVCMFCYYSVPTTRTDTDYQTRFLGIHLNLHRA